MSKASKNKVFVTHRFGKDTQLTHTCKSDEYNEVVLPPTCISQWSTSWASLEATGCHHQLSVCIALPRQPPWLSILVQNTKHNQKSTFSQLTLAGPAQRSRPIMFCFGGNSFFPQRQKPSKNWTDQQQIAAIFLHNENCPPQ